MKKTLIIFIIIIIVVIIGAGYWVYNSIKPKQEINSFEKCVSAGNPVMESYPRQCRFKDKTFAEEVFETFTQLKGPVNYSIDIPFGWFSYDVDSTVIFTQDSDFDISANTEGFAIGSSFYITLNNITDIEGITTYDQWLDINGMTDKSPFFIESGNVSINGKEMKRVVTEATGFEGKVLHYVYFVDVQRVIILSQFPYDLEIDITKVFEKAVQTFKVLEHQDGTGILPFDSGVFGKVLLGPTCPVIQEGDNSCADKLYSTTIQVISTGSPKSSPFATVESNKDGNYTVMLPPGKYSLQALGGGLSLECGWKNITIEPSKMTEVNLSCDTGIR